MWHPRQLCLFLLVVLAAWWSAVPAVAQRDPAGFAALYGNWELTWQRADRARTGATAFTPQSAGAIRWANAPLDYFQSLRVDGDMVRGHSVDGAFELRLSADATTASGTWGRRPTAWRRVIETVDRVEVVPGSAGTLDYANLRAVWVAVSMPGNLPTIRLRVAGTGLPQHPNDAGTVEFDDPGLVNPRLRRFPDARGTRIEIEVALREPRPGAHTMRINGRSFPWTLDLAGAPAFCTGMALAVRFPHVYFGENSEVRWSFTPSGCTPPPPRDGRAAVGLAASPDGIISHILPGGTTLPWEGVIGRVVSDTTPIAFRAERAGAVEILAMYEGLVATARVVVEDRPACTGLRVTASSDRVAVGGRIELHVPAVDAYGLARGSAYESGSLAPPHCSVGRGASGQTTVDHPDRARLEGGQLHGLAPGPVTVTYRLGNLAAVATVEVVP